MSERQNEVISEAEAFDGLPAGAGDEGAESGLDGGDALPANEPDPVVEPGDKVDASSYSYSGGRFEIRERGRGRGVYHVGMKDGKELPAKWICSPLRIEAQTRDAGGDSWGRLLRWHDADGRAHQWAMPIDLLQADGVELRRELARQGLMIAASSDARALLATYLQVWPCRQRTRCVDRLGWHGGVYVTPSDVIGEQGEGERVIYQSASPIAPALAVAGTVPSWRAHVAALASGNSRLMLAVCAALAGPLLELAGESSGGLHLRGASSTGKTTALKVAASVWGPPERYIRTWRATANGLEGVALLHNDCLLVLDEIGQVDGREAGEIAYMIANGQGKSRAARQGTPRPAAQWRTFLLSSGEIGLSDHMRASGKRAHAGQDVRLADVPADAGAGMGMIEDCRYHDTSAALVAKICEETGKHYGAVGIEWLRHVTANRAALPATITADVRTFVTGAAPADASGQVIRVARRFGLLAVAGELASRWGLTGWDGGAARAAVRKCFDAWLDGFGGPGDREDRALLEQVRAFFETHGDSRFGEAVPDANKTERAIINRAGYRRHNPETDEVQYLVLPETFRRDVCAGFDAKQAAKVLVQAGWLTPGKDGKVAQCPRIPALGRTARCYVFGGRMWE